MSSWTSIPSPLKGCLLFQIWKMGLFRVVTSVCYVFLGFPTGLDISSCTWVMQYSTTEPKDFRKGSAFLISSAFLLDSSFITVDVRTAILHRLCRICNKDFSRFVFKGDAQKNHKRMLTYF